MEQSVVIRARPHGTEKIFKIEGIGMEQSVVIRDCSMEFGSNFDDIF